jgi:hypothetical protein
MVPKEAISSYGRDKYQLMVVNITLWLFQQLKEAISSLFFTVYVVFLLLYTDECRAFC